MRPAVLVLAVLAATPPALALALPAEPPEAGLAATITHDWVPSFDGTPLRVTWFEPNGTGPFPVVLRTHGWAGHREVSTDGAVGELLGRGYAVLTWDSRGFGESGGFVELDSPDYEVKDVSALLDWVARKPGVRLDGPGDPRAAMSGGSYAGGIQLLAGSFDRRLDALAPEVTWHDLRHSLAPNDVLKLGWVGLLYGSGLVSGHTGTTDPDASRFTPNAQGLDPVVTRWLAESLALNRLSEDAAAGLEARSIAAYLDGDLEGFPPTMLVQGWRDTLFTPNEAVWTYLALRDGGVPAALVMHGGGHGYPTPAGDHLATSVLDFLDYWVLLTTSPVPPPIEAYRAWDGTWQLLGDWPDAAAGGVAYRLGAALAAAGVAVPGTGVLSEGAGGPGGAYAVPSTVVPAGYREVPNFADELGAPPFDAPGAAAVFATEPLPEARVLLGTPRLRLTVHGPVPDATLFVKLLHTTRDHQLLGVLGNQVTPVRLESGGADVTVDLELVAAARHFEAGDRLALSITASDSGHAASRLPLPVLVRADGGSVLRVPWTAA